MITLSDIIYRLGAYSEQEQGKASRIKPIIEKLKDIEAERGERFTITSYGEGKYGISIKDYKGQDIYGHCIIFKKVVQREISDWLER